MRLNGVFPDAAPALARGARAAAVLGWCSPQSSVPRQTVGHHARAAKYETGQKAACEGCRGEVPSKDPTAPPQELGFFFLIYPPTRAQWGARAGGLWGGFPDPAKLICMGFAKNRLASSQQRASRIAARRGGQSPQRRHRARDQPALTVQCVAASLPACLPCLLFSHIPSDQGAVGRAGRRARGWISRSRKTHLYGFR